MAKIAISILLFVLVAGAKEPERKPCKPDSNIEDLKDLSKQVMVQYGTGAISIKELEHYNNVINNKNPKIDPNLK